MSLNLETLQCHSFSVLGRSLRILGIDPQNPFSGAAAQLGSRLFAGRSPESMTIALLGLSFAATRHVPFDIDASARAIAHVMRFVDEDLGIPTSIAKQLLFERRLRTFLATAVAGFQRPVVADGPSITGLDSKPDRNLVPPGVEPSAPRRDGEPI